MTAPGDSTRVARILTVSATYGAGGSVIAPLLASRLGLPFADRLLLPAHAQARSEERATEEELEEEPRSPFLKSLALLSATWGISGPQDSEEVPERLRREVETSLGPLIKSGGVILGRAGAVAIGRRAGAFHVRLDGPRERRARRGAVWEGVDLATAHARLEETDTARSRSLQRTYGRDPADPSLYHLVIDSTTLSVDTCTDLIASAAEGAWSYDDSGLEEAIAEIRSRSRGPAPPVGGRER
jgi:cytidylate kinase